jgi:hypothetical protein
MMIAANIVALDISIDEIHLQQNKNRRNCESIKYHPCEAVEIGKVSLIYQLFIQSFIKMINYKSAIRVPGKSYNISSIRYA